MIATRKIRIDRREPMSSAGLRQWSFKLRKKIKRFVFKNLGTRNIPYSAFETRYEFGKWIRENFGVGTYYCYFWKKGYYKNKNWLRPYNICKIKVTENGFDFIDLKRLSKYKFFEPKKSITREIDDEVT